MPSKFINEECELADPTEIANAFNSYFANIGKILSSKIEHDDITVDYKQYLNLPAVENLQFKCITEETTIKAIDELENKSRICPWSVENSQRDNHERDHTL